MTTITIRFTYKQLVFLSRRAEEKVASTSAALKAIPGVGSGQMGLTPDAVKLSPAYREAYAAFRTAWQDNANINRQMLKQFPAQVRADRVAQAAQRQKRA